VSGPRAVGVARLRGCASRAADSVRATLLPRDGAIEGHPEIEMALVELYRVTGAERHLDLARTLLERRGGGFLGSGRFGTTYWQDHLPVRVAPTVTGHAVRQLYLDAGAVDVATETGDRELLDAVHRRWRDMVATRTYLTGGLGSRHVGEAFGDPYELPPDRAYAETCAAIGGVMVAWRLLLATGDPLAADVIERTALNGVLGALSRDGTSFFYVNPLQRRTARVAADPGTGRRAAWYPCACCPPNLVRFVTSWPQLLATRTDDGVRIQQYAEAEIGADVAGGRLRLAVETSYPWSGGVRVTVREAPEAEVRLELRVPGWASGAATVTWPDGGAATPIGAGETNVGLRRRWRAGEVVSLDLPIEPRIVRPHPRVDAVRGCVAIERGPLVGAFESDDLPGGVELEDVAIRPDEPLESEPRPDLGDGVVGVSAAGEVAGDGRAIRLRSIPYHAWANRSDGAMRVWIPVAGGAADGPR
jgi:DUF1680 family protein